MSMRCRPSKSRDRPIRCAKIEIALQIRARHEAPEQACQRDLHLAGLFQGLLKMKGVLGPVAASKASRMDHAPPRTRIRRER